MISTIGPAPKRCGETLIFELLIAAVTLLGAGGPGGCSRSRRRHSATSHQRKGRRDPTIDLPTPSTRR
jgi:hypothetical protein